MLNSVNWCKSLIHKINCSTEGLWILNNGMDYSISGPWLIDQKVPCVYTIKVN